MLIARSIGGLIYKFVFLAVARQVTCWGR